MISADDCTWLDRYDLKAKETTLVAIWHEPVCPPEKKCSICDKPIPVAILGDKVCRIVEVDRDRRLETHDKD